VARCSGVAHSASWLGPPVPAIEAFALSERRMRHKLRTSGNARTARAETCYRIRSANWAGDSGVVRRYQCRPLISARQIAVGPGCNLDSAAVATLASRPARQ
jgi:hypothetical protein